jgi:adenylate cyclase
MNTSQTNSQHNSSSNVRHELLTPINHLLGYTEMMLEDCEEQGLSGLLESLGRIRAISKELQAAIERFLPSSPNPAEESEVTALQAGLQGPMAQMFQTIESIERDIAGAGKPNLLPDFARIRVAADLLNRHLRDLTGGVMPFAALDVEMPPSAPRPALAAPARHGQKAAITGKVLVVDDDASNRDVLCRRLEREGHETCAAQDGAEALRLLSGEPFDLVLLDFMMPGMTGSEVLAVIKSNPDLCHIPVIMISAADDLARVVQCIELGAEDYLPKPFEPVLLRARIGACLEKKRLRDEEQRRSEQLIAALREAENQKKIADSLLRNTLPDAIAQELLAKGSVDPKYFEDVTIVFTDFVGFTASTESIAAEDLVMSLHEYFTAFDRIVQRYGLEKLKTIGDSYMLAGGLPVRSSSNPVDAVLACIEFLRAVDELGEREGSPGWKVRIGIHTGPVIAGVVGIRKFAFDVWGETVNFASRMESSGMPGRINISGTTYGRVKDFFECESRGKVLTKEKKEYDMYFVNGVSSRLLDGAESLGAQQAPRNFVRRYGIYFQKEPLAFPGSLLNASPE